MAGCCAHQVKIAYKVESLFAGSLSENVYRYLKRPFQGSISITGFSFYWLFTIREVLFENTSQILESIYYLDLSLCMV